MSLHPVLERLLERLVTHDTLTVTGPHGPVRVFGTGPPSLAAIRFKDTATQLEVALDPRLKLGEAYMDGRIEVERGTLYDVLAVLCREAAAAPMPLWVRAFDAMRRAGKHWQQFNPLPRARRNVSRHYDIDGRIYDLFLDADKQYSCAYFARPGMTLEDAQLAKKRHIAAKLALHSRCRILDIGSGWGGMALYLAGTYGADVQGITLSEEQLRISRDRAARLASGRARFDLMDYRRMSGTFDRIVSVGMFEHVGVPHYARFFGALGSMLAPDGVALIHTIGRSGPPGATNAFIAKYIFPGGYIPALSEMLPVIERSGLIVADIEVLRLHYAETLRQWRRRFMTHRAEAARIMGERFCRMWEFYLAGSEASFRFEDMTVFQIQLIKSKTALPLTRGYIEAEERRLSEAGH